MSWDAHSLANGSQANIASPATQAGIADKAHSIGAYVRVFHYGKYAVFVMTTSETVTEVCQAVLMKRAGEQYTGEQSHRHDYADVPTRRAKHNNQGA